MTEKKYHLKIAIDPHFQNTRFDESIFLKASEANIIINIDNEIYKWGNEFQGLNAPHNYRALITINLDESFLSSKVSDRDEILILPSLLIKALQLLENLFKEQQMTFEKLLQILNLCPVCVYYVYGNEKLQFTFTFPSNLEQISEMWEKMIGILLKVMNQDLVTHQWLDSLPKQKNGLRFLIFNKEANEWQLIDRLLDACIRLSAEYRNSINDDRISKPYVVFNEDNYNQYTYFDKQWVLQIDTETIIMPQPNDISLYVSLTKKNLEIAQKFYHEEIEKRSRRLHLPLLNSEEFLKYYDYFETVIAAIIFSYTSIETLANISIPYEYTYKEIGTGKNEGIIKTYSKNAIERHFTLRDKFKKVLPDVLQASDPINEDWWEDFIVLEDIRNEIIHTKQSKSEERYSFFLSKRLFKAIECNKLIIKFYGRFINAKAQALLFDFPYGFDYDSVPPSLMTNEHYFEHYSNLHNPWNTIEKTN